MSILPASPETLQTCLTLDHIRRHIGDRAATPITDSPRGKAAVALILTGTPKELSILFIERAHHPQDPWSGNLAFPGGRIDPADSGPQQAAQRETLEEIGLDLTRAEYLGQLDDIAGAYLAVTVSCFVYFLPETGPLKPNHEIGHIFHFPLCELSNPGRHQRVTIEWQGKPRQVDAINLLGPLRPLLWGITYRLVTQFIRLLAAKSAPNGSRGHSPSTKGRHRE